MTLAPNTVVGEIEPKTFPPLMMDQRFTWVFPDGKMKSIGTLDEQHVLHALSYCIANASQVRKHYSVETLTLYDETQNPRRWILDRVATRALMRRLIELEDEEAREREEEEKNLRFLTQGAEEAIELALDNFFFGASGIGLVEI